MLKAKIINIQMHDFLVTLLHLLPSMYLRLFKHIVCIQQSTLSSCATARPFTAPHLVASCRQHGNRPSCGGIIYAIEMNKCYKPGLSFFSQSRFTNLSVGCWPSPHVFLPEVALPAPLLYLTPTSFLSPQFVHTVPLPLPDWSVLKDWHLS